MSDMLGGARFSSGYFLGMSQSSRWNLRFGNVGFLSDDLLHLHSAKDFVDAGFIPNAVCTSLFYV